MKRKQAVLEKKIMTASSGYSINREEDRSPEQKLNKKKTMTEF